jgi:hypothetical protein
MLLAYPLLAMPPQMVFLASHHIHLKYASSFYGITQMDWYNITNNPVTRIMGLRRIISRNAAIATVNFAIKDCRTGGLIHAIPNSHIVTEANQYSARVSILINGSA